MKSLLTGFIFGAILSVAAVSHGAPVLNCPPEAPFPTVGGCGVVAPQVCGPGTALIVQTCYNRTTADPVAGFVDPYGASSPYQAPNGPYGSSTSQFGY